MASAAGFVVVLVVLGLLAVLVGASRRVTGADVAWLLGTAPGERAADDEVAVVTRYLRRHRHHRLVGGLLGVAFGGVVGLRWTDSIGFGLGQRSPLADVLFCGIAGVLVGALVAEGYRLRPPPGRRTASLAAHPPVPSAGLVVAARLVMACALVVAMGLAVAGLGTAALASACLGAVAVAVAEVTRTRIADRRRPLRSARVERLDRRLRAFAATSVAHLQLAAAVLTALWVLGWWVAAGPGVAAGVGAAHTVTTLAGLGLVVLLLHRAAPRAARGVRLAP